MTVKEKVTNFVTRNLGVELKISDIDSDDQVTIYRMRRELKKKFFEECGDIHDPIQTKTQFTDSEKYFGVIIKVFKLRDNIWKDLEPLPFYNMKTGVNISGISNNLSLHNVNNEGKIFCMR